MLLALVVAGVLVFAYWVYASTKRPPNFPSGPINLPVIGALPFFKKNMYETMKYFRENYGRVFSFKLGSSTILVLTDYNHYKEASAMEELLFRPDVGAFADFRFPDENRQVRGLTITLDYSVNNNITTLIRYRFVE